MKYESENIRIIDQEENIDEAIDAQIMRIKTKFAEVLHKEQPRDDVMLSILATMYIVTCHRIMGMPKEIAKEAICGAIDMQYAEDEMDERGTAQWLN